MIPKTSLTVNNIRTVTIPTNTYRIIIDKDRVSGETDGLEAMKQAVYLILSTERYAYPIYSWNYGVELKDLFGQPTTYVEAVLEYRIRDALMADERITDVRNFEFSSQKNTVSATFEVVTNQGNVQSTVEVTI